MKHYRNNHQKGNENIIESDIKEIAIKVSAKKSEIKTVLQSNKKPSPICCGTPNVHLKRRRHGGFLQRAGEGRERKEGRASGGQEFPILPSSEKFILMGVRNISDALYNGFVKLLV